MKLEQVIAKKLVRKSTGFEDTRTPRRRKARRSFSSALTGTWTASCVGFSTFAAIYLLTKVGFTTRFLKLLK
jgi:hypothetical protein